MNYIPITRDFSGYVMLRLKRFLKRLKNESPYRPRRYRIIIFTVVVCSAVLLPILSILKTTSLSGFYRSKFQTDASSNICGIVNRKQLHQDSQHQSPRVFIAALLHNSADLFPHWSDEIVRLIHSLSISDNNRSNIFVSIHASGKDLTIEWILRLKDELTRLNIPNDIQANNDWDNHADMKKLHRIDKLALLRNIAIRNLLRSETPKFSHVLYLNDVIFCSSDVLSLIQLSSELRTDLICSTDYVFSDSKGKPSVEPLLYDTWVARDIHGHKLSSSFPYSTTDAAVIEGFRQQLPFKVASCWNGIVVIKADLIQDHNIMFRSSKFPFECRVSECELLARDLHHIQRNRILMVPSIKVAYSIADYRNLMLLSRGPEFPSSDSKDNLMWKQELMVSLNFNSTPIEMECCPLRHNEKLMHWQDCFMETHWNMAQYLVSPKDLENSVVDYSLTEVYNYWRNNSLPLTCLHTRGLQNVDRIENIYQVFRNTNARYTPYRYISNLMSFWWHYPCANYTLIVMPFISSPDMELKYSLSNAKFLMTGGLYVGIEVMSKKTMGTEVIRRVATANSSNCGWRYPLLQFSVPDKSTSANIGSGQIRMIGRCLHDVTLDTSDFFTVPNAYERNYWINSCQYWPSPLYHPHRSCPEATSSENIQRWISYSQKACSQYLRYNEILAEGQVLHSWNNHDDSVFGVNHPVFRYSPLNLRQLRDLKRQLKEDIGLYLSLHVTSASLAVYLTSRSNHDSTLLYEIRPQQSISPIKNSTSLGYFSWTSYLQLRGRGQLVFAARSEKWCEEGESSNDRNGNKDMREKVLWKGDSYRLLGKSPTAGCFFLVLRSQSAALEVYAGANPDNLLLPWAASRNKNVCFNDPHFQ